MASANEDFAKRKTSTRYEIPPKKDTYHNKQAFAAEARHNSSLIAAYYTTGVHSRLRLACKIQITGKKRRDN